MHQNNKRTGDGDINLFNARKYTNSVVYDWVILQKSAADT
jgi:hypothetical protein